jgi:hypothetical protein
MVYTSSGAGKKRGKLIKEGTASTIPCVENLTALSGPIADNNGRKIVSLAPLLTQYAMNTVLM